MKKIVLLLVVALLAGCASSKPMKLWDATTMGALPYRTLSLKEKQSDKVTASVNVADIQRMIHIKEQMESAAGPKHAGLFLAEGNEPNGFSAVTTHGPIIAVNIGMVNLIGEDEDAMAALVGHELAHLYLDHLHTRQEREENRMAASAMLSIALGMFGIPLPFEVTNVATSSVASKFSREEEREADSLGLKYMIKAGYDPYGSVRLQEKLRAGSSGSALPFFSSHPSNAERIENLKHLATEYARSTDKDTGQAARNGSSP